MWVNNSLALQRNTQRSGSLHAHSLFSEGEQSTVLHSVFCLISCDCHSERTQDHAAGVWPVLSGLCTLRLDSRLRVTLN